MRAMTVIPGRPDSAELSELPNPQPKDGELLVEPLCLGVCGTDREIIEGGHGEPPPGRERLVLGHELLARVKQGGAGLQPGQVVAPIVPPPDPVACACSAHERVLVTGGGPIGLLAALMGAQRGVEVHVLDRSTEGPKPEAVHALGAQYHAGDIAEVAEEVQPYVVVECTGVAELVAGAMQHTAPGAIVCLTGVASSRTLSVDVGALNNELVLENDVVFGSVNANRRHFERAVGSLREADPDWLRRLITRTVPLDRWPEALEKGNDDI